MDIRLHFFYKFLTENLLLDQISIVDPENSILAFLFRDVTLA